MHAGLADRRRGEANRSVLGPWGDGSAVEQATPDAPGVCSSTSTRFVSVMRKQRKITQTELAAYAGLSRAGIVKIEFGASDIKLSTLISIANLLGLNLFYNEELVGVLIEDDEERLSFSYAKSWLDKKSSFNISIN